jgi:filamentous hemagglutinin
MGRAAANEWLKMLENILNHRMAEHNYHNMSGLQKGLYWIPAGLDNFTTGIKQTFSRETLPTSPTQFTSGMISGEAWDNHPIYGGLYDFGKNLVQAAPGIAASAAAKGVTMPLAKKTAGVANVNKGMVQSVKPGSLSNLQTRQWYDPQVKAIGGKLDTSLPLKQQARQAFDMRNQYRTQGRELMSGMSDAKYLDANHTNMTWDEIVHKYQSQGYHGDRLWRKIIESSMRTNKSVNQHFGLE